MVDIPLAKAVLCWTAPWREGPTTFQVRRLGDPINDTGPHESTAGDEL